MKSMNLLVGSETERHLKRVEELVSRFVRLYNEVEGKGWTQEYMSKITEASVMHDIGKATIPERILYKAGPLTDEERAIIETHPITGEYLLRKFYFEDEEKLEIARNIILNHHEKWDGTGYPQKKRGEEIPLEARIVSLIDTYDALVSYRCYKEPWSKEEALAYIEGQSGKQFDPELLVLFLRLFSDEKDL